MPKTQDCAGTRRAAIVLLLLTGLTAGCADDAPDSAQVAAPEQTFEPLAPTPEPSSGPALWKVEDADTTVYLFGTFHALKPGVEWFGGAVKTAYEASSEVALEATDTQDTQRMGQLVLQYAIDPDGRRLSSVIGPQMADALRARLAEMNLTLAQLEPMEPWMAAMTLAQLQMQAAGFQPALGVDVALQNAATESGKTLVGIEGAEAQLKLLDSFPEERQIAWLSMSLRDWDEAPDVLGELLSSWRSGDIESFAEEMVASMAEVPNLNQALMVDRNEGFADWVVERMARPGVVFMAIGAGHLAGPNSVQDFLQADGYTSRRL